MSFEAITIQIANQFSQGQCPKISFDDIWIYVDDLLEKNLLIKHSEFSFTGEGFADIINKNMITSPYRIIAVKGDDKRLDTKVKGQGVYFILTENGKDKSAIIFTWSENPFTIWPLRL